MKLVLAIVILAVNNAEATKSVGYECEQFLAALIKEGSALNNVDENDYKQRNEITHACVQLFLRALGKAEPSQGEEESSVENGSAFDVFGPRETRKVKAFWKRRVQSQKKFWKRSQMLLNKLDEE